MVALRPCVRFCRIAVAVDPTFRKRIYVVKKTISRVNHRVMFAASGVSLAQSLQTLVHQPPDGAGIGFLMTDGTVIFQGNQESDWAKLTPDSSGSYVKGTWTRIASLPSGYVPDAFASAVLADGRLIIEGGEYNNNQFAFTNLGAI